MSNEDMRANYRYDEAFHEHVRKNCMTRQYNIIVSNNTLVFTIWPSIHT